MLARVLRSAVTLATLVVVYQVYVLTVAPLVEPPAVERRGGSAVRNSLDEDDSAVARYQAILAAYFPADHWSLATPPKVIRLDQLMLVLKDYRRHDNGSIDLEECAVLVMPGTWRPGNPPPREAVVLEAPGGAHLQFDEDFQPTRGKAGRIVRGEFPGQITIRSDMHDPGPEDDLRITTRDLVMNETLIRTEAEVDVRFGANHGSGRRMVIRLSRDEHIKRGPSINGVESLEVLEDVDMELDAGKLDVLGEAELEDKVARTTGAIRQTALQEPADTDFHPPVRITCQGRFHFDLLNFIASFDQKVEVRRMRLDGPFDGLDCSELSVHFAAVNEDGVPIANDDPNLARNQRRALGNFEPVGITAIGSPVRAESVSNQMSARAQRMRINLYARRITLDGGREVMLAYGANEAHARFIEYQLPEEDSPRAVGELSIKGAGWIRTVPDENRPDRVVEVTWQEAPDAAFPVQLTRRRGQPVLQLAGQPEVDAHRLGKIRADRMEVLFREVPADGPDGPALELSASPAKLAIIPERLMAAGEVSFASPELTGRTHQLEADFEPWEPPDDGDASDTSQNASGSPLIGRDDQGPPSTQYHLSANQMHLDLALSGKSATATNARCDGSVVLRETSEAEADEEPLVVRGNRLTVQDIHRDALITVTGRPGVPLGQPGTASIEARGLRLAAAQIDADQATSKFWIDGPGLASMAIDGEAFGEPAGTSVPVTLTWQTGLNAKGREIVASGRVVAESQHGWAQADRAIARLTHPISMQAGEAADGLEVAQVSLADNVVIDHRAFEQQQQQSHENLQLQSLTYHQLDGRIEGTGPGVLRSIRYSAGSASFADLAGASSARLAGGTAGNQADREENDAEPELRFLRVDFAEGLSGNVNRRILRFHRRVRSVYGPVDDWQQELPLHAPHRLPPETVTLACELLEVSEDPLAGTIAASGETNLGPLEVRAIDNVEIEGRSSEHGVFQAQAVTASYNQRKDLFVLEGDGQQDAVLRHRDPQSGRYVSSPAGTILYWRSEPRVELRDVHRPFDFQQTPSRSATRQQPIR